MQPPMPSATRTWHNDTYAAISPSRAELSCDGKTIIITGAGSGIGREAALAFASAGASRIVLLGRREAALQETASLLPQGVWTETHSVDITQREALQGVAASIGKWDVLVLSAGYISKPSSIASSNADDWWQSFETNAKGTFLATQALLPTANPSKATILALVTGTVAFPSASLPGLSAYMTSKLAEIKFIEFLAAENENIFAASVHPGFIETAITAKSGANTEQLPMDQVQLPAHFLVWMASSEAAFLDGRSVWANWDVEELKQQESSIRGGIQMTSGISGWPYQHT
ncbi:hypothetical protein NUW58_g6314 [Xylaria curta]|uniref:Uncharacterized protein n=1 Tax=Xylaria curta TaxID=42375 RepID=A0ACC1NWW0_9PEZI|nr:hypothetical protein NUW58_g6314 [Xylaria curta]